MAAVEAPGLQLMEQQDQAKGTDTLTARTLSASQDTKSPLAGEPLSSQQLMEKMWLVPCLETIKERPA